jgi:predicted DNA-binding protein YlxM (UPF0122 family)
MLSQDLTTGEIAMIYNLSTDYIYQLKTKRTYGWLEEYDDA